jgi:hypothetical protein
MLLLKSAGNVRGENRERERKGMAIAKMDRPNKQRINLSLETQNLDQPLTARVSLN